MKNMTRIASFSVNHDYIKPGMYLSRIDKNIYTYDLRTRTPNNPENEYMDNLTMHSVEHMMATYARNSEIADKVVYFGPMGCMTGFYLLLDGIEPKDALPFVVELLKKVVFESDKMFGATRQECGNYKLLSLDAAKNECAKYLKVLENYDNPDLIYPKGEEQ